MRAVRRFLNRLRAFALRRDLDDRVREEIEQHLDMQTAENMRAGLAADEARRQAILKFGSTASVAASYRDERSLPVLDELAQDLRYALRQLRKTPIFAVTATLTLALGIGVNTTMFTIVYGVLLKGLPYPQPERLMRLVQAANSASADVTIAEFEVVRARTRTFSSVAAYRGGGERRIGLPEDHNWISTVVASTDFLQTLGMQPQIGREFTAEETRAGGLAAVMLSDHVWRTLFGADPFILERTIRLNDTAATVVGILPARMSLALTF
jgi:hypothetical protein